MTTSTPVQGEGRRAADVAPPERGHVAEAAGPEDTSPVAATGATARTRAAVTGPPARTGPRALLVDRRFQAGAGAVALVLAVVAVLLLTRSDGGAESVIAGDRLRTTSTVDAGSALPSPVRPATSPSAVPLPIVPGPVPTASTTPTTEAPTTTRTPTTRGATVEATSVTQELAPAAVPAPAPEPTAPPATVPATEPPTTAPAATAPPTTAAPAPPSLQVASRGGSIVVACSGDQVALRDVSARDGFQPDVRSDGPKEVRVRFRADRHTSTVDVGCKKGVADPDVRESGKD